MSTQTPPMIDLSTPFIERLSKRQRFARLLILSLFAVTLTGGLVITQINVKRGLIVYSSEETQRIAGSSMVLRVEGRSLPFRQSIRLSDVKVQVQGQGQEAYQTTRLKPALDEMWQGVITLPIQPGRYQLFINAEGFEHPSVNHGKSSNVPITLNASLELKVVEKPVRSFLWPPLAQTPTTARERLGEGTLSFYPMDQRLTSELPSDIVIVAQDHEGDPWQGEVKLTHLSGLLAQPIKRQIKLNSLGIGLFSVTPRSMGLRLRAEAFLADDQRDTLTSSDERFSPRVHQFNILPAHRLVKSGGLILFDVQSTYASSKLYVDLWRGNEWLSTQTVDMLGLSREEQVGGLTSMGRGGLNMPQLYAKSPQLLWLQTYQLPYQIDEVRGGAYLLWVPKEMDNSEVTKWLLDQVKSSEMEPSGYWHNLKPKHLLKSQVLRLFLGRLMRNPASPSVLINSGVSAQITAEIQQASYLKLYLKFMAALCLVTTLWLVSLVWFTYKRHISSPEWSDGYSVKQARRIAITWLAPMVAILMVFFGAMILLVFKISW
jgi:hypothetical protein